MKYAIIIKVRDRVYLTGFTNTRIEEEILTQGGIKYTVELKEMSSLFLRLEGDAEVYLS